MVSCHAGREVAKGRMSEQSGVGLITSPSLPRRNFWIVQERNVLRFPVKNMNEDPVKSFNSVIVQMNGLHSCLVPDESSKDAGSIAERNENGHFPTQ